jgi:hypothetical protein
MPGDRPTGGERTKNLSRIAQIRPEFLFWLPYHRKTIAIRASLEREFRSIAKQSIPIINAKQGWPLRQLFRRTYFIGQPKRYWESIGWPAPRWSSAENLPNWRKACARNEGGGGRSVFSVLASIVLYSTWNCRAEDSHLNRTPVFTGLSSHLCLERRANTGG